MGLILVNISQGIISFLLAFAGGAMIYIAAVELVPEALRSGPLPSAVGAALGLGVIVMLSFLI